MYLMTDAKKIRLTADKMTKHIEAKKNPAIGQQRVTGRRARIADGMYAQGERLENIQNKLYAIVDAIEAGTLPESLKGVTSKAQAERILATHYRPPSLTRHNLKDIMEWSKGAKGIKEARELIERRGLEEMPVFNDKEIEAIDKLLKVSEKKAIGKWEINNIKDRFSTYKALSKIGIKTEAQWKQAHEDLQALGKQMPKEVPKEVQIKKLERELLGNNILGYFPTPKETVEEMIEMAEIGPGMKVLEPSAGKGNIADVIRDEAPEADLSTIEWNNTLSEILKVKEHKVVGADFFEHKGEYDRIIMNPPFEKGADIDHVRHAYGQLGPGGKVVAIMGEGSFFRSEKKYTDFREWLDELGGTSEKMETGSFKKMEKATGVSSRIVVIDKKQGENE